MTQGPSCTGSMTMAPISLAAAAAERARQSSSRYTQNSMCGEAGRQARERSALGDLARRPCAADVACDCGPVSSLAVMSEVGFGSPRERPEQGAKDHVKCAGKKTKQVVKPLAARD